MNRSRTLQDAEEEKYREFLSGFEIVVSGRDCIRSFRSILWQDFRYPLGKWVRAYWGEVL
jgi:hypothetical protein